MLRSSISRWILGMLVLIAVLGILRFKPWRSITEPKGQRAELRANLHVGFLPVT